MAIVRNVGNETVITFRQPGIHGLSSVLPEASMSNLNMNIDYNVGDTVFIGYHQFLQKLV